MSDADKSSKTELPTMKRLEEAFDEGNFPRAPEIGVTFILIASFAYLSLQGAALADQVMHFTKWILSHLHEFKLTVDSVGYLWPEITKIALAMLLPFVATCAAAAILAGGLQTGFKMPRKVWGIKFDRLNPVNGFGRLFNGNKFADFGISLLKFIVVAWVVSGVISDIQRDPIFYTIVSVRHIAEFIFKTFLALLYKLIFVIGIIAGINYAYHHWQHIENLRMTKQEVADEVKNSDGNPEIKRALRKRAYQILYRQVLKKVPLADVVVTNPTHYAVALKYERGKDAAPVVLAKGKDLLAQRIKQIARKHEVPMVENRPIARALYKSAAVGKSIPSALYQAVAQILAFVYRAHRYYFHRLKARRLTANT